MDCIWQNAPAPGGQAMAAGSASITFSGSSHSGYAGGGRVCLHPIQYVVLWIRVNSFSLDLSKLLSSWPIEALLNLTVWLTDTTAWIGLKAFLILPWLAKTNWDFGLWTYSHNHSFWLINPCFKVFSWTSNIANLNFDQKTFQYYSQVSHRNPRSTCLPAKDHLLWMSFPPKSTVLTISTMMGKRLNPRMAATTPVDVMAFLGVKGSGITLRVPVRVLKVKIKSHSTLVMQLSASDACLWTRARAHLYGEGKWH